MRENLKVYVVLSLVFTCDASTSTSNIRRRNNVLFCHKQKALMINALLRLRMLLALVLASLNQALHKLSNSPKVSFMFAPGYKVKPTKYAMIRHNHVMYL